jgi:hypothetical protein
VLEADPQLVVPSREIPASDANVAITLQMAPVELVAGDFLELRAVFDEPLHYPGNVSASIDGFERLAGDKYADGVFASMHAKAYAAIDVFEPGRARN